MKSYDVIISGGGPVGLGLAIDLGQRGVRVAVFEKHHQPSPIPKGQNLTQRTMEHMVAWGVEPEIRAAKTIPKGVGIGGLTAYGTLFSGHHYDWYNRASVAPYYHAENERLPQYATETVLRARIDQLESIDFWSGWTVDQVDQSADSVTVSIQDGDRVEHISARYLVGCDGPRSNTRRRGAFSETVQDHDREMVLIVFESPEFFELIKVFKDKQFYNVLDPELDGYWKFFGLVEWQKSFFFHAPIPKDADRDSFDFKTFICQAIGKDVALSLTHVGFWDLRISSVDSYQDGRVFLAGDAAHSHPPYGGYGINTGFEDARNLGWKLAAKLAGWAGENLLASYSEERAPVFASTANDFIDRFIRDDREFLANFAPDTDKAAFDVAWQKRAVSGASKGISTFAPHYGSSPITVGGDRVPTSAVGQHELTARPGRHFPPQTMVDSSQTTDHLGQGFTLFQFGAGDDLVKSFQLAAQKLDIPLALVQDAGALAKSFGDEFVLVRPDGFAAWVGNNCQNPRGVLCGATGH